MKLTLRPPGDYRPLEVDLTMILIAVVAVAMLLALLYTLIGFAGSGLMGGGSPTP